MTKDRITHALQRYREPLIYAFGWGLVALSPFLMMYFRSRSGAAPIHWDVYRYAWIVMDVFFLFFLFHNHFVAPLFFRPHKLRYFIFASLLVVALGAYQYFTHPFCAPPPPPPPHPREVVVRNKQGKLLRGVEVSRSHWRAPSFVDRVDWASLFILILLFGANLGVKIYIRSEETHRQLLLLREERLASQLKYLRAQINPHFFMNTLNNIHALVDIDPERAKSSIILLSRMMRYIVYEGVSDFVPVQKEVDFLTHYITLMRLRFTDRVHLSVEMQQQMGGEVPPLLLIMFVENAFKHGVSYRRDTHIRIVFEQKDGCFHFFCENPKADCHKDIQGGIGQKNVRKRLDLIYGDRYHLRISDEPDRYAVDLKLPQRQESPPAAASRRWEQ